MTQGELLPTPEKQIHQISPGQEGYSSHFRGESDWDSLGFLAPNLTIGMLSEVFLASLVPFGTCQDSIGEPPALPTGAPELTPPPPTPSRSPTVILPPLVQFSLLILSHQISTLLSDRP